jgi:L-alanine-DL-glutamate epimerase-like enolase superfamily enzyme
MKVGALALHHISMPLVALFETSFGRETVRECIIVELRAEGITGYGECVASHDPGYRYETTGTAWHVIKDFTALNGEVISMRPGITFYEVNGTRSDIGQDAGEWNFHHDWP